MAEIRANFIAGLLTSNLTNIATTLPSAQLANLPAIVAPNFARITLDPLGLFGNPEIVHVTAHTASATSATIARGQEGTSARAHTAANFTSVTASPAWRHAPTAADFSGIEIDVDSYGALGDSTGGAGSGTDDTTAINNAFAAAGNAVVRFSPGKKYRVTAALNAVAGMTVRGYGATLVVDQPSSDIIGINVNAVDDVTVEGLTFLSTNPTTRGHQMIAFLAGANRGTVQFCKFSAVGQYAIIVGDLASAGGAAGHRFLHNYIDLTSCKAAASPLGIEVFPKGGASYLANPGVLIEGNTIIMGSTALAVGGIKVNSQQGARIVHNVVTGGSDGGGAFAGSIVYQSSTGVEVAHNTIDDSRLAICGASIPGPDNGLRNAGINVHDNIATHCSSTSGSWWGIAEFLDGTIDLSVINNYISGTGTGFGCYFQPGSGAGIAFRNLVIDGNTFIGGSTAIDILADSGAGTLNAPKAKITNNFCYSQSGSLANIAGNDVTFSDNVCVEFGTYGASIVGDRTKANGNHFIDGNTSATAGEMALNLNGANTSATGNTFANTGVGNLKYGLAVVTGPCIEAANHYYGMQTANISGTVKSPGWNGTAEWSKPTVTGAKGGNAALANLLTALAAMGLLTDSTS